MRPQKVVVVITLVALLMISGQAQTVRNPKLATADLESAKEATKNSGGNGAELVYAARIDAVTRGTFDSLVVVYATGATPNKQYFGVVLREGQSLRLVGDKSGTALPRGDRFLRIGLRHEAEKSPLLRVMGATGEGEAEQRNLDFRFDGKEFALVDQSLMKTSR